jgi:putative endonuclease
LEWFVYLVRCEDGSLYCGIAKDPAARFQKHLSGKGARYTRARKALELVYREGPFSHGEALRRERQIKSYSKEKKAKLLGPSILDPQTAGPT